MSKKQKAKQIKKFMLITAILFIIVLIWPSPMAQAVDNDNDGITDSTESSLAARFAPTLYFKAGENFFPVDVDYHITNSWLYNRPTGIEQPAQFVINNPAKDTLDGYTGPYYLLRNMIGDYEAIKAHYTANMGLWPYHIYCHVMNDSGYTFVQYWFFYAYNDGSFNQHEGDWEMISIMLSNIEPHDPIGASYSQHHGGEYAAWADVEKTGDHPHVYVAKGSHACYFRSYQGKVGMENDDVGADGEVISHSTWTVGVNLEVLGELGAGNHVATQDWLDYGGVWGDWEELVDKTLGFAGPYGPGRLGQENDDKWNNPASWTAGLFTVDTTWFTLCWFMYYLLYIILAIFAILVLRKIWKIIKLKREGGLLLGEVLKTRASVGILMGFVAIGLLVWALFEDWYTVNADFTGAIVASGDIFVLDGMNGVSVNFLVTGTGMSPLFSLGVPFSLILAMGIALNLLDIAGVNKPKKLGNGYIRSGIFFLILLGIVLLIMMQFGALLGLFPGLPVEAFTIATAISQAPLGGTTAIVFAGPPVLNATFVWGFAIGGILLVASALIKILAGLIIRSAPGEFA